MLKRSRIFFTTLLFSFIVTFAQDAKVFVSNYPLAYMTERILGTPVFFPTIDGDPAFWEPTADDIAMIQESDLILLNGATYEKWAEKVTLPSSKVVETAAGFSDNFIVVENEVTHSHGNQGEHSHAGTTFTTWIDFSQADMQAAAIKDALIDAGIGNEKDITANYEALHDDLMMLDNELLTMSKGYESVPLMGSHPVYQYFARRYNLNLQSVHWEPETFPSEDMWAELATRLETHPAKWFIWEGEPLAESVERLQSMGIESIVFDPSGNTPDGGDFLSVMKQNIENVRAMFQALASN